MYTKEQINEITAQVLAMPLRTEIDRERKKNAFFWLSQIWVNDGAMGKVLEILSAPTRSKKTNVSPQGKSDLYIKIGGGVYPVERKTNGGKITSLFAKNAPKFIVYSMDYTASTTKGVRRVVEPKIYRTETFLSILIECNAIKSNTYKGVENQAIQVSSKKLYTALSERGTPYDKTRKYTLDDIE